MPMVCRCQQAQMPRWRATRANLSGDHTSPILKPAAADIVKRHGEMSLRGVTFPTPSNQCWPEGVPYVFEINAMQMVQGANNIRIPL